MINNFLLISGLIVSLANIGFSENTAPAGPAKNPQKKTTKSEIIKFEPKDSVRFGLKGGVNFSNVLLNIPLDIKTGRGLVSSLALEIPLVNQIFFQPELGYSQHRISFFNAEDAADTEGKVDFLELQVLGKFRFVPSENFFKPFILLGLAGGYVLKSEAVGKTTYDTKASGKDYDISAAFGAGAQFQIATGVDLGIEARYLLGLVNGSNNAALSSKNRTVFVGATLFF